MPRRNVQLPPLPDADQRTQVHNLLAETQALSARLAALNEVAAVLQSSLDSGTAIQTLAREARWILDFQYCSIVERHNDGYRERVLRRPDGTLPPPGPVVPGGPIDRVLRTGHAQLISTLENEPTAPPQMASAVIVPLRSAGAVIGALSFFADKPGHYRLDDLRIAAALAAQASMVVQNTRLFQEVAAARDELHTILESISDGVLVIDIHGNVVLMNRSARRMLGLTQEDVSGSSLIRLLATAQHNEQRLLSRHDIRAIIATARAGAQGSIRLSDQRTIEWAHTHLRSNSGEPGYVVALRDISDRVELEELRDDLIAMLVHDLRTPLSGIMMSIDLLDLIDDDPEMRSEVLARARRSSQIMLSQINTLLDLRRLEAGRLVLEPEPQAIGMLMVHIADTFKLQAELSQIDLQVQLSEHLPLVTIDTQVIGRVLENLLGNALKFTESGKSVILSAHYLSETGMLEVCVSDRGIGVPEHLREQIFAKFVQAKGEQSRRGFGLGLTFCRMAIEAHQGTIGVRDNPEGGSIFWFRLPQQFSV